MGIAFASGAVLAGCTGRASPSAQKHTRIVKVAYLSSSPLIQNAPDSTGSLRDAFQSALHDLGYVDGKTISVDYRFEDGAQQLEQSVRGVIHDAPDVIVAADGTAVQIAAKATRTIPIVGMFVTDPVASGFVASLARPGGNVTGPTLVSNGLNAKRLQILKSAVPSIHRVGVIWNENLPDHSQSFNEMAAAAPGLGLDVAPMGVQSLDDLPAAFQAGLAAQIDAVDLVLDPLVGSAGDQLIPFVRDNRLPSICEGSGWTAIGGLMSYGTIDTDLYTRAASYVDRIVKGAKPAEMPVERPTKFALIVNLPAAQQLGITIPQSLVVQATEIIQ